MTKEMSDTKCACNCGELLPFMWAASGKQYIKGHKPHVGEPKISRVQSNSRKIELQASTTSVPLMLIFAQEQVKELTLKLALWENTVKALKSLS